MSKPLAFAFGFALLPLMLGSGIFVSWLFTAWEPLMQAGLLTILVGLLFIPATLAVLTIHYSEGRRSGTSRTQLLAEIGGPPIVILMSLYTALLYCVAARDILDDVMLAVENRGAVPIESFVVSGAGPDQQLGPIKPHGRRDWWTRAEFFVAYRGCDVSVTKRICIDRSRVSDKDSFHTSSLRHSAFRISYRLDACGMIA